MKTIPLTQGKTALVDDFNYERFSVFRWYARKVTCKCRTTWYAVRMVRRADGKQHAVYMHREVLGVTGQKTRVDHEDGDTLDNREHRLRVATCRQNKQNSHKQRDSSSKFKGVCWNRQLGKWKAQIRIDGRLQHLGYFQIEEKAANAYDCAAKKAFGEFALLNEA